MAGRAGDWLNCLPSAALSLKFRPQEFSLACLYRLGLPIYRERASCPLCDRTAGRLGDHAVGLYPLSPDRIARHNQLRDVFYHTLVAAGVQADRETRFLLPGDDASLKPADCLLEPGLAAETPASTSSLFIPASRAISSTARSPPAIPSRPPTTGSCGTTK